MSFVGSAVVLRDLVKGALEPARIVVKFLCCLHVTSNYLLSTVHVHGVSMLPTLNMTGDLLLVEHVSPRLGKLKIGDMVSVQSPLNPRRVLTKRVLGMEGDTVTYSDPTRDDATHTAVVPKGHVWIQGDNIYRSHDSRQFGPVPLGLIQGKVLCRMFIDNIGRITAEKGLVFERPGSLFLDFQEAKNSPKAWPIDGFGSLGH